MEHRAFLARELAELLCIQIEPEVKANRSKVGVDADAEACGGTQVGEAEIARQREDVAGIDESDPLQPADDLGAKLTVENHDSVTADRETGGADGVFVAKPIEREAANRGVAAGKETLAGRYFADGLIVLDALETAGGPHAGAQCHHHSPFERQLAVEKALGECADKPELRPDSAQREIRVDDHELTGGWVEEIIP